jgi:hypothetical protein
LASFNEVNTLYPDVANNAYGSIMTIRLLTFIFLFVTCVNCTKSTQKEISTSNEGIIFPYSKRSFEWGSIETPISDVEKKKLTDSIPWIGNMYSDSIYLPQVHSFDFNNDGLSDFIYSGPGPTDDWMTVVGINQGSTSKYFNLEGHVVDIKVADKRVTNIFTISLVATSPGIEGHRIVKVDYNDNLPVFNTIFESEKVDWTPLPNDKQLISYEFQTIDDTIILRDAPIELDTPYNYFLEINGNQFGKIATGTRGRAIGQRTDSLQNAWLCVFIYPEYKIIDYPLYPQGKYDSSDRINRIVWIKDKGIKRVN